MVVESEDAGRAGTYLLLAKLLLQPDHDVLDWVRRQALDCTGDDDALTRAWACLAQASRQDTGEIQAAHAALFIAAGTPAINPYESYFLTGRLMDRSLAVLRRELQALGLARVDDSAELEDHLAALCEALAALIQRGESEAVVGEFFQAHLWRWAPACLEQIRDHARAGFYAALARFALEFLHCEQTRFAATESLLETH